MSGKSTESTRTPAPSVKRDDPAPKSAATGGAAPGENQTVSKVAEGPPKRECVADDGRPHVGRAVNGEVCSAHAISHKPDGTPRVEASAATRAGGARDRND